MPRTVRAPATPTVLTWARKAAGYSEEQVAALLKKKTSDVVAWEVSGTQQRPTFSELVKLAKLYNRPTAIFFFPEPPDEEPPTQTFRTLPDAETLEPDTFLAVRQARAMQLSLMELTDGENPAERRLLSDVRPGSGEAVARLASRVREYLGLDLKVQLNWESAESAFKWCRDRVERAGIFVFKRAFEQADISGFCLGHAEFPLIYINNSHVFERQQFTLFHELAHLLFHVDGVTAVGGDDPEHLTIADRRLETRCNQLAAEILVPNADFRSSVAREGTHDAGIVALVKRYRVSREVVLRRALDSEMISQTEYRRRVAQLNSNYVRVHREGGGGNYYRTQLAYLGENFLRLAFARHAAGLVSEAQLASYTGVRAANLAHLENLISDAG